MLKPLTVRIATNYADKETGVPDHLTCLLRYLYADQEAQLELDMEQQTGPNWERSTSRLYIVTLLIKLICRVH